MNSSSAKPDSNYILAGEKPYTKAQNLSEDHIEIRADKNEKDQQVFFVSTKVNPFINGLTMLEKHSSGWEKTTIFGLQMMVKSQKHQTS